VYTSLYASLCTLVVYLPYTLVYASLHVFGRKEASLRRKEVSRDPKKEDNEAQRDLPGP